MLKNVNNTAAITSAIGVELGNPKFHPTTPISHII
jgi:hypothetical protein